MFFIWIFREYVFIATSIIFSVIFKIVFDTRINNRIISLDQPSHTFKFIVLIT